MNYFPISRLLKLMKNHGIPVTCSSEALAGPLEDVSSDGVTCWIVMRAPAGNGTGCSAGGQKRFAMGDITAPCLLARNGNRPHNLSPPACAVRSPRETLAMGKTIQLQHRRRLALLGWRGLHKPRGDYKTPFIWGISRHFANIESLIPRGPLWSWQVLLGERKGERWRLRSGRGMRWRHRWHD